jgi:replicative DNA helicase
MSAGKFYDLDAEKSVLTAMFLMPDDLTICMSIIPNSDVFYDEGNRSVFESIRRQYEQDQPVDMISTVHDMKSNKTYEKVGGAGGLAKIVSAPTHFGHAENHARILLEMYIRRATTAMARELLIKANEEDVDVFAQIASLQTETEKLLQNAIGGSEKNFEDVMNETESKWLKGSTNGLSGHSTGLTELDRISGGLTDGELTIVGARPGQGKTALVVSLIRNLAKQNIPCGIFSLEMSKNELAQRLVSQESQVFAFKIKSGELTEYDKKILANAKQGMRNWNIRIFDEGEMNLRKLRSRAIMWQRKFGIKVLFIDYLQLMSGSDRKGNSRENDIAEISRGLKILARELNIPVIALSQLSRRVEDRPDKMPQLSDLRESGSIEQDADCVWFLMRPDYYKMTGQVDISSRTYDLSNVCIIDQAKMRSGNTGQIALKFDGPLMRMSNYDNIGSGF